MTTLNLSHRVKQLIYDIDQQISECYIRGVDYSQLIAAKRALVQHLTVLEGSLEHMMESYGYYGVVPDSEDLRSLIEEMGYDQARQVYGDELDEAWAASVGGDNGFM